MSVCNPLRGFLFIYEFARFMLMIVMFAIPLQQGGVFPYAVYISPNALFPLMTYFLYIRFELYRSYIALYIAGKIIAVISSILWLIFSFSDLTENFITSIMLRQPDIITGVITVLLIATDIVSVFCAFYINNRIKLTHKTMP